jgi:shikimate kinase
VSAAHVRIALAGPMGVGKSTVGRDLALRLGVPFVDLDALVGPAGPLFASAGESGFRARERAMLAEAVRGEGVLALGGGTVVDPANVALLRRAGWSIVVLDAPIEVLESRVAADLRTERPLAGRLAELVAARAEAYAAAGERVEAGGTVGAVVERVLAAMNEVRAR